MIRITCVLFILFAFGSAMQHVGTSLRNGVTKPGVHKAIHLHTHNSSVIKCPDFEARLTNETTKTQKCIMSYDPQRHNLCSFLLDKFKTCTKPMTDCMKGCLPDKSKDTPEFMIDSLVSLFKAVCNANGTELLELTQPCITHTISDESNSCQPEIVEELQKMQKEFPSKTEVCKFYDTYRTCLYSLLEQQCMSSVTILNFLKFYDALKEPCKKK